MTDKELLTNYLNGTAVPTGALLDRANQLLTSFALRLKIVDNKEAAQEGSWIWNYVGDDAMLKVAEQAALIQQIGLAFKRCTGYEIEDSGPQNSFDSLSAVQYVNRIFGNRNYTPLHIQGDRVQFTEAFFA